MIRNYFKTALHNLWKNKVASVINIFGLSIGLTCSAMNNWLEDFAYRVDIQWWMFALAGLAAVMIALLTVSWQAIRAAVANPVESLRTE